MTRTAEQEPVHEFQQPPFSGGVDSSELQVEAWSPMPKEIEGALEWGVGCDAKLVTELEKAAKFKNWTECGNGVRFKEDRSLHTREHIVIRHRAVGTTTDHVREIAENACGWARRNVEDRAAYGKSVEEVNDEYNKEQRGINRKRGFRALGDVAVGGAAAIAENLALIGTQPANIALGLVALGILYESTTWAVRAVDIKQYRRSDIQKAQNHSMPENAEQNWLKLKPAVENIVAAYSPNDTEGDITLFHAGFVMNLDVVRAKLELPGGPSTEDYTEVLDYLSDAKDEKHGTNTCELYPVKIVKDMLETTKGGIWNDEVISVVTVLAKAQADLLEKTSELSRLEQESKVTTKGMLNIERIKNLKKGISRLYDVSTVCLLQLLKLNFEYHAVADGAKKQPDTVVPDPFAENNLFGNKGNGLETQAELS